MTTNFNIPIITALMIITIGGLAGLIFFLHKCTSNHSASTQTMRSWFNAVMRAVKLPLLLILIVYAIYFSFIILSNYLSFSKTNILILKLLSNLSSIALVLALFWFIIRLINSLTKQFYKWAAEKNRHISMVFFPLINNSLKAITTLILINILLPFLSIPTNYLPLAEKCAKLLLIAAITWIALAVINAYEQYIIRKHDIKNNESFKSRKIYTQITVLRKIIISFVITVALAIALMTFEHVRELGATLLASAGIITAMSALAAQKTLSSTFAGLQIALTQPIKINDAVLVENEFGNIEEITLNYVIIKLWDLRRLVVPINYFIEKPFQNWTRSSSNLLGTVMLYVDYSIPVEDIRTKFQQTLNNSPLWDKNAGALQVTDAKEHTLELRLLVSAADASKLFNLRCEVREKMITYIKEKYPHSLPRIRVDSDALLKTQETK